MAAMDDIRKLNTQPTEPPKEENSGTTKKGTAATGSTDATSGGNSSVTEAKDAQTSADKAIQGAAKGTQRSVDWLASRSTPGSVGVLVVILLLLVFFIVPVDKSKLYSRAHLVILTLFKRTRFASSGQPAQKVPVMSGSSPHVPMELDQRLPETIYDLPGAQQDNTPEVFEQEYVISDVFYGSGEAAEPWTALN